MRHTIVLFRSFLIVMVVSGLGIARGDTGDPLPAAVGALDALLSDPAAARLDAALAGADLTAFDVVRKRYECVTGAAARGETILASGDAAVVRVEVAAQATLPLTHATGDFPPNWIVRLRRDGGRWQVASLAIPEADVAGALARATGAGARVAILAACPRFITPELARRICERGDALDSSSDSIHAAELADEARGIARECGSRAEEVRATWLTAKTLESREQFGAALKVYESAQAMAATAGDAALIAATAVGVAACHARNGDFSHTPELEKAYALALQLGDERTAAVARFRIGIVDEYAGRYAAALAKYAEAAERAKRAGDRLTEAGAVAQSGVAYEYMNHHDLSYDFVRRGIELFRQAGNIRGVIRNLRNLADMEAGDEHLDEAEQHLREVEALLEKAPNPRTTAYIAATRADIALKRHDMAAAERACMAGLPIAKQVGNESLVTIFTHDLGLVRFEQKRYEEAIALSTEAIALTRATPNFDTYWHAEVNLGNALAALGRVKEARDAYGKAVEAIERSDSDVASERDEQYFFSDKNDAYFQMFRTWIADRPDEAVLWVERAGARSLLDVLARGRRRSMRSLTAGERQQETTIEQSIAHLNVSLTEEQSRPAPDAARIEKLEASLAAARRAREVFTRGLYEHHPDLALARGEIPAPSIDEIRRAIPRDGAILEYAVLTSEAWGVVLTRDAAPRIFPIHAGAASLWRMTDRFVAQIDARDLRAHALSRKLYDLLVAPAGAALRGKKIVGIIADHALRNLPFQALSARDHHYFVEKHALFYAPSAAFLVWEGNHRPQRHDAAGQPILLAFGNPQIAEATATQARAYRRDESLSALPDAETEVRALQGIYGAGRTTLRVGAAATETEFKSIAGRYRILHLATHGMYDDTDPMYSHLVLARTPDENDDGLLEAREIVNLDLDTDLAVLSACETGRNEVRGGEGMIGLSWALLAAGCRTEVLTQTKVGSASARDLMIAFHRSLARRVPLATGRSVTLALQEAQVKMLRTRRRSHPFYWAPFITVGNGW